MKKIKVYPEKYFDELLALGIPLQTLEQSNGWTYLIEHGDCFASGWNVDHLDFDQAKRLLEIVEDWHRENPNYSKDLLISLKQKLSKIV